MLNMIYIGDSEVYPINFNLISDNVVELTGDFPIKTDGFILSRPEHDDKWDYSTYTTVYQKTDGGVQFSNDGSVYVEPEDIDVVAMDMWGDAQTARENEPEESEGL